MRKKKRASDIKDIAAFFVELVSRSREFFSRPVRIHFIADFIPDSRQREREPSDIGESLPILRTVLFDAAQNTAPNPDTTLHVYTPQDGSAGEIAAWIAKEALSGSEEFFIITLGKAGMQAEAANIFAQLPAKAKSHITLLHLPAQTIDTGAETRALVSAVRMLITGEPIPVSAAGLRIFQEKT